MNPSYRQRPHVSNKRNQHTPPRRLTLPSSPAVPPLSELPSPKPGGDRPDTPVMTR